MQHRKIKKIVLLLGLILPVAPCRSNDIHIIDGHSHINIKVGSVQGTPKNSFISASISGHTLTVSFSQNIGQVAVEITTATGATVDCLTTMTPTGFQCYIPDAGDYIVTFTLSNGDEYYGEFEVLN